MNNRILSFLLACIMTLTFVACGNNSTAPTPTDSSPSKPESQSETAKSDVTLSVAIWDANQEPGLQKIFADFTAKTGIKTEVQVVTWAEYWTMLEAAAQGGSLPDVFWMHSNEAQRYMSNGLLLDLSDKIKNSSSIQLANYPEEICQLYSWEGKNYALPKDVDTIALWYNRTMFDEAGIPYPDESWTWDTLREAAKKLTKPDGSQYGFAMGPENGQGGYYNIIYDMGGYVISEDKKKSGMGEPGTIKAMQFVENLVKDGSMPSLEVMSENKEDVLLCSGKVAMATQGSWMVAAFRDNEYSSKNIDVAVLPKDATTGKRMSVYNGLGWTAAANGKHTDEAWQLIEYLGTKEAQLKQAELGITMSAYKGTSDAWTKCVPQFKLEGHMKMMNDMVIYPHSKSTVKWEGMLMEDMKQVWMGTKPAEQVCKEIAEKMNAFLAEE